MNEIYESVLKAYTPFIFMGPAFCKESIEDRVNLLESNVLNCCPKIKTTDLRKIGLKMWESSFRELN